MEVISTVQEGKCGIEIWKNQENFGRKIKPTGCIYLPGTQFLEVEGHLNLSSCLHDAIINPPPRTGKYISNHKLYRQFPPRRAKDKNTNDIESYSCVRNVVNVTPVLNIEREQWGACSILRKVDYGVYIFSCSVISE